jgi:3-deoxy-7-phosphoheptulonate synthase
MVVVMKELATDEQIQGVIAQLTSMGFDVHRSTGALRTVLGAVGGQRQFDARLLEVLDGVQEVVRITEPYKLASRTFKPDNTVVVIDDVRIGSDESSSWRALLGGDHEQVGRQRRRCERRAPKSPRRAFKPRSSVASRGSAKRASGLLHGNRSHTT